MLMFFFLFSTGIGNSWRLKKAGKPNTEAGAPGLRQEKDSSNKKFGEKLWIFDSRIQGQESKHIIGN